MRSGPNRRRSANEAPIRCERRFILYWMTAARRTRHNYALDRAIELAKELDKPLLVLDALRVAYPWASSRFHRFVLDGMGDNQRRFARSKISYYPYVEPEPGAGSGLVMQLARFAAAIVTDEAPGFFIPRMLKQTAPRLDVHLEVVDSWGLSPLEGPGRAFARAYDFRRYLQKTLPAHLALPPRADPLRDLELRTLGELPESVLRKFPQADLERLGGAGLAVLPLDHRVGPAGVEGGERAARKALRRFVTERLRHYAKQQRHPDRNATSELSPYLHFGHLSAHEVLGAVARDEDWKPALVSNHCRGQKRGWWNLSEASEAFLDQLVTWRELGANFCWYRDDFDRYESLPPWARATLERHRSDPRPALYDLEQFEAAETHDPVWNAAQRQLLEEGKIHNALRMLWGKKILEWSDHPRTALEVMIHLNNKYALDGRDPNSYSGIFWCLGRYDRPWAPERPIFGSVRTMTSLSARRKLRLKEYLARFGDATRSLYPPSMGVPH